MFVANHISWADIPVLGGVLDAAFVAKSEVEGFALVGWLANLARTVYVDRDRRQTIDVQRARSPTGWRRGAMSSCFPKARPGTG